MAKRNYIKDYQELPKFAERYIGKRTLECIDEYSEKRKCVHHRIAKAFWNLVEDKVINVEFISGLAFIISINDYQK